MTEGQYLMHEKRVDREHAEWQSDVDCPQCDGRGWIGHYVRGDWRRESCPRCGRGAIAVEVFCDVTPKVVANQGEKHATG